MSESALSNILKRLESATVRLEEIAQQRTLGVPAASATPGTSSPSVPSPGGAAVPVALAEFDDLINGPVADFVNQSAAINDLVKEQVGYLTEAFRAQRALIQIAAASKKPDVPTIQELLKSTNAAVEKITNIKDSNRPSPFFNHLSTVAEGIPALGWVVVEPAPAPFVGEMKDSAQFYANRVVKEYKDKDRAHVEWTRAYISILTDLQQYVKKWHTTGLAWNPKGGDAKSFNAAAPTATPPPTPANAATPSPLRPAVAANLFSELNKDGLTTGLRKVDKSEMTHKNPELRATSVVPSTPAHAPAAAAAAPKFGGAAPKAPPKFALEGNKWVVENQPSGANITIDQAEVKHVVYIYNCTQCTIQIKSKVNAITIDGSKKVGVVIDNVVSTIDIVNCKSAQVQVLGKAPTVVVDKTDGLQLFLSPACLDVELLSAKSSEMNVSIQGADGDYVEKPVPEQFKTTIVNGSLVTVPVEHKG
ncbi:adenylate cyclase associated N terminal-domain-containing protein [Polychytrium aggregatum]|uniref:adenylate cyclase associated N terminal-domain-containing protein n=1 Tax=Polychytrium aggregatum TaxID=110093 RepID=UPI0022FF3DBE|nr:adenylate cyclase associated N terminal-domain-containing protein [Polychytrium aggregatum]KAI9203669.1 adenylate cyclase associated N terminal-domain-containing protein [Polychytrium aggregatum]